MPMPFEAPDTDPPTTAGYLKFLYHERKEVWLGALFIMNARGEPVEFAHARVRSPKALLWRTDDLRARCMELLCGAMFEACPVVPDVILCLAVEAGDDLFARIRPEVPVIGVTPGDQGEAPTAEWVREPQPDSRAGMLMETLTKRGLLIEPFARAEAGLREVYSEFLR